MYIYIVHIQCCTITSTVTNTRIRVCDMFMFSCGYDCFSRALCERNRASTGALL